MKQKLHNIKIINRNPGSVSSGANTLVLVDGKELRGVTSLKYEVKSKEVAKLTLEMFANVQLVDLDTKVHALMEEILSIPEIKTIKIKS